MENHADERKEHDAAVVRLQTEYDRLTKRLSAMYVDKLDGRIDNSMYDKMSSEWCNEQDRCLREISWHQKAEQSYMDEGVTLLTLAKDAQRLFDGRPAEDKRRLLNFVLSNSSWSHGKLNATFRQPFNLIAEISDSPPDDDGGGGPAGLEPATRGAEIRYSFRFLILIEKPKATTLRPTTDWPPKPREQRSIKVVNLRQR
jgi:site-specific DNA recombinase